jgi:Xaa-Pro dipeptidase
MMIDERQHRVARAAGDAGGGWTILTDPNTVCYASGHEAPYETGPSPFSGGPGTAFVAPDGVCHLLLTNNEPYNGRLDSRHVAVYEGFSVERPLQGPPSYLAAARRLADELGLSGTVAIEEGSFPAALGRALESRIEGTVAIDDRLMRARMVKTDEEIATIRRAAAATDAGQRAAVTAARAGRSELEVLADVRCAIELAAGGRTAMITEVSAGPERAAGVFDTPRPHVLVQGDTVVVDLAPRVAGYWADSCNTLVVGGEPTPAVARLLAGAQAGIDRAREALRPGLTASAFDGLVRQAVVAAGGTDYAHHSGHSIGVAVHENPRLVPGDHTVLEPGMVIMVEPATYERGVGGARREWMFLLTETENEVISGFEHVLAPA